MKIQLDTIAKTIKIEEAVNLGELTTALEKLLPNGEWKEFKIEVNTTIAWTNPIVIERPYHPNPWEYPWITYQSGGTVGNSIEHIYTLNAGTFNVDILD